MERNTIYIAVGLLAGAIIGIFISYSLLAPQYNYYNSYPMGPMMPMQYRESYPYDTDRDRYPPYGQDRYYPPGCCQGPTNFTSNGESIYFTGINEDGERIPFTGGPYWLLNHGGSCVNCHGRDGRGGIIPMMCNVETPDIRYSAMTGGEHGHEFTEEDIANAIVKGIDHDGDQLDWCMPRWQMSDKDLTDIIDYLKVLQ